MAKSNSFSFTAKSNVVRRENGLFYRHGFINNSPEDPLPVASVTDSNRTRLAATCSEITINKGKQSTHLSNEYCNFCHFVFKFIEGLTKNK